MAKVKWLTPLRIHQNPVRAGILRHRERSDAISLCLIYQDCFVILPRNDVHFSNGIS